MWDSTLEMELSLDDLRLFREAVRTNSARGLIAAVAYGNMSVAPMEVLDDADELCVVYDALDHYLGRYDERNPEKRFTSLGGYMLDTTYDVANDKAMERFAAKHWTLPIIDGYSAGWTVDVTEECRVSEWVALLDFVYHGEWHEYANANTAVLDYDLLYEIERSWFDLAVTNERERLHDWAGPEDATYRELWDSMDVPTVLWCSALNQAGVEMDEFGNTEEPTADQWVEAGQLVAAEVAADMED